MHDNENESEVDRQSCAPITFRTFLNHQLLYNGACTYGASLSDGKETLAANGNADCGDVCTGDRKKQYGNGDFLWIYIDIAPIRRPNLKLTLRF